MAKKFSYRGFEIEALQKMSLDEFAKIIPSNMRRSLKRMNVQVRTLMEKIRKAKAKNKAVRTHIRYAVIIPEMVGTTLKVYNGKEFIMVNVGLQMLGHRLGEYAIPIKNVKHSGPGVGATRGSKSVELK